MSVPLNINPTSNNLTLRPTLLLHLNYCYKPAHTNMGTKIPGYERSRERKFQGTFVPRERKATSQLITRSCHHTVNSSHCQLLTSEHITKPPVVTFSSARRSGSTQKHRSTWIAYLRQVSIQQDIRNAVQFGLVIRVQCVQYRSHRRQRNS